VSALGGGGSVPPSMKQLLFLTQVSGEEGAEDVPAVPLTLARLLTRDCRARRARASWK